MRCERRVANSENTDSILNRKIYSISLPYPGRNVSTHSVTANLRLFCQQLQEPMIQIHPLSPFTEPLHLIGHQHCRVLFYHLKRKTNIIFSLGINKVKVFYIDTTDFS